MAKTVTTTATSYCTAAEFLKRNDKRTVARLVADADDAVTQGALPTDPNLTACLLDASGMVESAILAGKRYEVEDLAALTGAALAFLQRLVSDLAMGLLVQRRPTLNIPLSAGYQEAQRQLELLRWGERIFGFDETADAGVMQHDIITPDEVRSRNDRVYQARRYFGRRSDESA